MKIINPAPFLALAIMASPAHSAMLADGDILHFSSAAGSVVSGSGDGGTGVISFDSAQLNSSGGIVIGSVQANAGEIDQIWGTDYYPFTGFHTTSQAITVIDGSTLDFSGWNMTLDIHDNPTNPYRESYDFGSTQSIANYTYDGYNFTIDYVWNADTDNNGVYLGYLGINSYNLHLTGTVSSVPVPAAVWLFWSGLIGLAGLARRKRSS